MITKICSDILALSTAVRTNVLSDVKHAVGPLKCDLDGVLQYSTSIVQWLKPCIDLSNFYVYPTNGITEGLNWWMATESRNIVMNSADYQWVKSTSNGIGEIQYISIPSAIDGNFKDIPNDKPIALDLAYLGSTKIRKIQVPDNVEYVFYSLSKPFGVRNVRTGWIFTKEKDNRLDALINGAKYYNYFANQVAEKIITNFDIEYVWRKLESKQHYICKQFGFIPSDSVWIATTDDPAYDKFKRGTVNRLCLAPCY